MPNFQLHTIVHDVLQAEAELAKLKTVYGKESEQYQSAEVKFKKLWRLLSLSRKPEEFLPVVAPQKQASL